MRKSPNRRVDSIAERRIARRNSGGPAGRSDMLNDSQMARPTKAGRKTLMLYMVAFARNQAEPHHAFPTPLLCRCDVIRDRPSVKEMAKRATSTTCLPRLRPHRTLDVSERMRTRP